MGRNFDGINGMDGIGRGMAGEVFWMGLIR
jgi:hypothetical protein